MSLADRLTQAMAASGVSVRGLANRTGLPRSTIQRLRDDHRKLGSTVVTILALATALHVSPGWLAFGDEEPAK